MERRKLFALISLILNAVTFALVTYSVIWFFTYTDDGSGIMQVVGAQCFRYFTIDSNILCALASACVTVCDVILLLKPDFIAPLAVRLFKFVGTVAVGVTFLTVIFFLGPTMGYDLMFANVSLHLHLICPVCAIASFIFFENEGEMEFRKAILGLLPTVIYGFLYVAMVIFIGLENGGWEDFYGFNIGGMWYITVVVMFAFTYGLSVLIWFCRNKMCKVYGKNN